MLIAEAQTSGLIARRVGFNYLVLLIRHKNESGAKRAGD